LQILQEKCRMSSAKTRIVAMPFAGVHSSRCQREEEDTCQWLAAMPFEVVHKWDSWGHRNDENIQINNGGIGIK
jgi:hypothetical protein